MTSLWFVPVLFVLGALALSAVTTSIDDGNVVPQSVSGDPTAAMQILYLISFSMLTLTGLVLSLVVVVVQLAMGVFSPRIVRQILQDRPSQVAIGLFAGTFAYAVLAMREIKTTSSGGRVPGLSVVVALGLVIICICALLWYVDHIGQSLRVAALVAWVAEDTRATLAQVFPDDDNPGPPAGVIVTGGGGVIFKLAPDRLVKLAEQNDCRLVLLKGLGDFVPAGSPLIQIDGDPGAVNHAKVLSCIGLGPERTLNQDVAYGIRMLVDIALSSLATSPFGDSTTVVQAIDRLHEILRQLATRPLHSGIHHDASGEVRVRIPTMTWDGYVRLTFDEIRQAGAGSPQVSRRLSAALDDLIELAPAERQASLLTQQRLLRQLALAAMRTDFDQAAALVPDASGIGSSGDLVTGVLD